MSFKQAMVEKDFKTLWEMLSTDSQKMLNEEAKALNQAAAQAEGPAQTALAEQASLIDMKVSELKTVDGEGLLIATLKIGTATDEKGLWDKVSRMEMVKVDDSQIAAGRAVVTAKVEETEFPLPFVKEDKAWKFDLVPDAEKLGKKLEEASDKPENSPPPE